MVSRRASRPPATDSLELGRQSTACPRISVTDASNPNEDVSASTSPALSSHSSRGASTPPSQPAQSPQTPASSMYDPGEAIDRAHRFSEPLEGTTAVPSVSDQNYHSSSPPDPSGGSASTGGSTSTWRASHKRLIPGNRTQQILGLGVCALTIVTVVYSHRADRNQRWENGKEFYEICQANNFTWKSCDHYRNIEIMQPPYDPWKTIIWNGKRATHHMRRFIQSMRQSTCQSLPNDSMLMPEAQEQFSKFAGMLVTALVLLASAIYLFVRKRRSQQMKLSDQSMARSEIEQSIQPAGPHTIATGANGESSGGKRLKAYVTAGTAISRLKNADNNGATRRRVSTLWRHGEIDPSLFKDAVVYQENSEGDDTGTATWEKIKRRRDSTSTFNDAASTLCLPKVDSNPPLKTSSGLSARGTKADEEEKLQNLHPWRRWFMPKRIIVSDQPLLELHEGDVKGAMAFTGAAAAATSGGTAMSMCPVEVPISKQDLPEAWMPMSPQDISAGA